MPSLSNLFLIASVNSRLEIAVWDEGDRMLWLEGIPEEEYQQRWNK